MAAIYPDIPEGARTGLLLFGAAFKGANDGAFLYDAGLTCTVVDIDPDRLVAMAQEYPSDWRFVRCDAYRYAHDAILRGQTWDVVSVDPFSEEEERSFINIPRWYDLANMMVVVGAKGTRRRWAEGAGWTEMKRNGLWSWLVYEKRGGGVLRGGASTTARPSDVEKIDPSSIDG